jgi:hypothetical protein
MGSSSPSCTFPNIGDTYEGRILELRMVQQRDFVSKKPKFWDNGDPMMQAAITLQTDIRDPEVQNDDGRRVLYAKNNMRDAIRDAVTEAGYDGSWVGGTLKVRYERDGVSDQGLNPPKLYRAKFTPPDPSTVHVDELARQYGEEPF